MTKLSRKDRKEQAKRFARQRKQKQVKQQKKEQARYGTEAMKVLADGTLTDMEKTVYHQAAAAQGGKAPCVVKQYDSSGHYILVQYSSGAPAAWVGQRSWIPNWLLTSS